MSGSLSARRPSRCLPADPTGSRVSCSPCRPRCRSAPPRSGSRRRTRKSSSTRPRAVRSRLVSPTRRRPPRPDPRPDPRRTPRPDPRRHQPRPPLLADRPARAPVAATTPPAAPAPVRRQARAPEPRAPEPRARAERAIRVATPPPVRDDQTKMGPRKQDPIVARPEVRPERHRAGRARSSVSAVPRGSGPGPMGTVERRGATAGSSEALPVPPAGRTRPRMAAPVPDRDSCRPIAGRSTVASRRSDCRARATSRPPRRFSYRRSRSRPGWPSCCSTRSAGTSSRRRPTKSSMPTPQMERVSRRIPIWPNSRTPRT